MSATFLFTENQKLIFFGRVIAEDLQVYSKTRSCCGSKKFKALNKEDTNFNGYILLEGEELWNMVSPIFEKLLARDSLQQRSLLILGSRVRKIAFEETSTDQAILNTTGRVITIWLETFSKLKKIKDSPSEFFELEKGSDLLGEMLQDSKLFPRRIREGYVREEYFSSFCAFVNKAVTANDRQNLKLCLSVMTPLHFSKILVHTSAILNAITLGHFDLAVDLVTTTSDLNQVFKPEEKRKVFSSACSAGALNIVELLLKEFSLEEEDLALGFQKACESHREEIIRVLHRKNPYLAKKELVFQEGVMTSFSYALQKEAAFAIFFLKELGYLPSSKEVVFFLKNLTIARFSLYSFFRSAPYAEKLVIHTWVAEEGFPNTDLVSFFSSTKCDDLKKEGFFSAVKKALKTKSASVLSQEAFLEKLKAEIPRVSMPYYDVKLSTKFSVLSEEANEENKAALEHIIDIVRYRQRVDGVPAGKEDLYYLPLEKILKLFAAFISLEENVNAHKAEIQTAFMLLIEKARLCYTGFLPSFLIIYRTLLTKEAVEVSLCEDESPIDFMKGALSTILQKSLKAEFGVCLNQKYDGLDGHDAHASAFMLRMLHEEGLNLEGTDVDNQSSINHITINFGVHFGIDPAFRESAFREAGAGEDVYKEIKARFLEQFYRNLSGQFVLDVKTFIEGQLNQKDEVKKGEYLAAFTDTLEHLSFKTEEILTLQDDGSIVCDTVHVMLFIQKLFHEEVTNSAVTKTFKAMAIGEEE